MEDLDDIVDSARASAAEAAAAATQAPTSTQADPAKEPDPQKVEPEPAPKPDSADSPTPVADPATKPDSGAPQPTVPASPEPTPEDLDEAYRLAGIDPKDEKATSKLVAHMRANKTPPAEPKAEEEPQPEPDLKEVFGKELQAFIKEDTDLQSFVSEHKQETAKLEELRGQITTTNKTIAALEARLNPPKVEGVADAELDEFTREDLQRRLDKAEREQGRLERHITATFNKAKGIADKYAGRVDKKADEIIKRNESERSERQGQQEVKKLASEFKPQWAAAFDAVYADSGLPPEEKEWTREQVQMRARDQVRQWIDQGTDKHIEDPKAFIVGIVTRHKEAYERHHVLKSRDHANLKREHADVKAPPPVPSAAHQPGADGDKPRFKDKAEALDNIFDNLTARAR